MDEIISTQASGLAPYKVDSLYLPDGSVSPHYADELAKHGMQWDAMMQDEHFVEVIDNELLAEQTADGPLAHLSRFAPNAAAEKLFFEWLAFINVDLGPWTTGGAIHFRPHWTRVLLLALNLGVREELPPADLACLAMAACFHDSRRKDPYLDTGHGARAAEYYAEFCAATADGSDRNSKAGCEMRFDPRAYLAMQWHDRDDGDGIDAIRRAFERNALPHLGIGDLQAALPQEAKADPVHLYLLFKDADGLDRVRLGANEPDPAYLRTDHALELLPLAREMLRSTYDA
ncbi:MAG: hypothetical protein IJH88_03830 [Eggerthellaceae bacterium]|nr:hypothetical protein [Eggerthellaceae bacterium]